MSLCGACARDNSSNVNQQRVYTHYSLNYDMSSSKVEGVSRFNFGGSTGTYLQLDGNSNVTFNGEKMDMVNGAFNDVYYTKTVSASAPAGTREFVMVYTDNNGKTFENKFLIVNLTLTSSPATAVISNGYEIAWSSPSVNEESEIQVTFTKNENTSISAYQKVPSKIASGTMLVSPEKLRELGAGTSSVKVCREIFYPSITAPEVGGDAHSKSCAPTFTVSVQ